jgi:hypothetical protein
MITRFMHFTESPKWYGFWLAFDLFALVLPTHGWFEWVLNAAISESAAYCAYRMFDTMLEQRLDGAEDDSQG